MATIEERKQQLEKKLKKMAEDNVVVKPVTVPNPFDPSEDTEPSLATSREEDKGSEEMKTAKEERTDETGGEEIGNTEPKRERKPRIEKPGRSSLSIEEYLYVVKQKCTTANIVIYSEISLFYYQKFFC